MQSTEAAGYRKQAARRSTLIEIMAPNSPSRRLPPGYLQHGAQLCQHEWEFLQNSQLVAQFLGNNCEAGAQVDFLLDNARRLSATLSELRFHPLWIYGYEYALASR